MCWKTSIEDETGRIDVKIWDRACYELFHVTMDKMRDMWETGNEKPEKVQEILKKFNDCLEANVTCYCKADTWTYGFKEETTQVQVNVNMLEIAQ
jgi:hypothetical protein